MKLLLPNGDKIKLDTTLSYEERLAKTNEILAEWQEYFYEKFDNAKVRVCLDVLTNYLILVKKDKKDNTVLTNYKVKQMDRGNEFYSNFSNLSKEKQINLGLMDLGEAYE